MLYLVDMQTGEIIADFPYIFAACLYLTAHKRDIRAGCFAIVQNGEYFDALEWLMRR